MVDGKKLSFISVPMKVCVPWGGLGSEEWTSRIQRPSAVPTSRIARGWVEKSRGGKMSVPDVACLKPRWKMVRRPMSLLASLALRYHSGDEMARFDMVWSVYGLEFWTYFGPM